MAREELRVAGLRLKLEGGAQLEQEMKLVRAQLRLGASEVKLFSRTDAYIRSFD